MSIHQAGVLRLTDAHVRRVGALPLGSSESALAGAGPESPSGGASIVLPELPRDRLELEARKDQVAKAAADPEVQKQVLTSVTAAANSMDKVATGTATKAGQAAGVAQVVMPIAQAVAKASGNEQAEVVVNNTADASTAAIQLHGAGSSLVRAAEKVRDGAAPLAGASSAAGAASSGTASAPAITSFGKVAAGLDVTRGVLVAPQLAEQVKTAARYPSVLRDPGFATSLAGNAVATGNGVIGIARMFNRTGVAAKLTPWAGIAADVTLMASTAADIHAKGFTGPKALEMAAYGADLAGNGLLLAGGNPLGLVLKGASLGMQAGAIGWRHKDDIAATAKRWAHAAREKVEDLARV